MFRKSKAFSLNHLHLFGTERRHIYFISQIAFSYYLLFELFTSVLADGLSMKFEWKQVSSILQDSSQYYCRYQ